MFYLKTLGGLALYRSDERDEPVLAGSKPLVLLALLAVMPTGQRRDHLSELLWPGSDRVRARRSLRQALFQVSKDTSEDLVLSSDEGSSTLTLNDRILSVDVWELESALKEENFQRVVELYDGPFLAGVDPRGGVEVEHTIEAQNSRLRVELEVAYVRLVADRLARSDFDEALRYAREYAESNPLDERAQATLIRTLRAAGDDVEALAAYQAYRTLLAESVGEEPGEEIQEAIDGLREGVLEAEPAVAEATERESEWELAVPADRPGRLLRPQPTGAPRMWPRQPRQTIARRALATLGIGIGVPAVLLAIGLSVWGVLVLRRALSDGEVNVPALAVVGSDTEQRLVEVRLRGERTHLEPIEGSALERPSPNGRYVAMAERAVDGWNVALRDVESGNVRRITDRPGDERPLDWSPDSRFVLYRASSISAGGRDRLYGLLVHDVRTGSSRQLIGRLSGIEPQAVWSPLGDRIAFVAGYDGQADVFIADFDGTVVRNVSDHPAWDGDPAWSVDASRLAFVSRRSGTGELYVVGSAGEDLYRVTDTEGEVSTPVWVSPSVLVFVRSAEDVRDLWAVDVTTGEHRRLTRRGDISSLVVNVRRDESRSWIDRVWIQPSDELVSPGQYLSLDAVLETRNGRELARRIEVRWSVEGDDVISPLGGGLFRVVGPGRSRVIASLGGWRADTLTLHSEELQVSATEVALKEDWTAGLQPERWMAFGDPEPYTRPRGGPEGGGVFINNGDAYFRSGAVSRDTFSLDEGLAVEVYGRLELTGQLYQEFAVTMAPPKPTGQGWGETPAVVEFTLKGAAEDRPAEAAVLVAGERTSLPFPDRVTEWRRYALQISADARVELIIDGRMYWRSPDPLPMSQFPSVRVGLGYHSFGTDILHGPLRVNRTAKYTLREPVVADAPRTTGP